MPLAQEVMTVTWSSADAGEAEAESYRLLRSRLDLSRLPRHSRDVTERVIYLTADFDYAADLVYDEEELEAAVAALAAGAPVIVDSPMVAAGITGCPVICKIGEQLTGRLARTAGISPAAASVRLAFGEAGPGAVWVVGCEVTALTEILTRRVEPAFVIGVPAGLLGAADAKEALRASGICSLSNVSAKGGAAVAAAAFDALLRSAVSVPGSARSGAAGGAPAAAARKAVTAPRTGHAT
jgi:precorrin-8X/cobalt-precorrin-8 methylmutase